MAVPEPRHHPPGTDPLGAIYDAALPEVYRYLRGRCGSTALAEELTSATFVRAATHLHDSADVEVSIAWLVTIARNQLVDHWRRMEVADRSLRLVDADTADSTEPWSAVLDRAHASDVLAQLPVAWRSVLTLRYLDDLSVAECARILGSSVRAVESRLVRAREGFRTAYENDEGTKAGETTGGRDD